MDQNIEALVAEIQAEDLELLLNFIESMGSFEKARAAIDALDELRNMRSASDAIEPNAA